MRIYLVELLPLLHVDIQWLEQGISHSKYNCEHLPFRSRMRVSYLQVVGGRNAKVVKDALMAEGIMVRHYAKKELSGYIRISVGKPEHTDALQRALQRIC